MLGETLRCIRIGNENMTIKEAAQGIGIASAYLSEIENNKKKPTLKKLEEFSLFYDMPLSKIMEIDEYNDTCGNFRFQRTLIKVLEYYIKNNEYEQDNSKDENPNQFVKTKNYPHPL